MSEIKSCPLCGSSASVRIDSEKQNMDVPNLLVACDNPKCQIYQRELHETHEEAIAAWNRRADGWISIKDMLPALGELILITDGKTVSPGHASGRGTAVLFFPDYCSQVIHICISNVTHWMPLPEPPNMKGGEA